MARTDTSRSDVVQCRYPRTTKTTAQMSREELPRVVANHRGYFAGPGGHLYDADGRHICQGYATLASMLELRGIIVPGRGIDWRPAS